MGDYLPTPGAEIDMERLFNIARDLSGLKQGSNKGRDIEVIDACKEQPLWRENRSDLKYHVVVL